ncbi:glycosyltransferase family 2 protein [Alteromonas confluentis]|uniref:glycosyltransferase family 2 protein n=1 Tax=Alteromonas confluentis TaxID=1656094 RepID=UPI00147A49B2|nr:glycosyltransferase family 2 protein [Alteromonas confluentis]
MKLIAVAKDEGAYLTEWIHHHLFYGFSEIEIVLNRTSDNSIAILEKIKAVCPGVRWRFADFVDLIPGSVHKKLQHIAYGMVLSDELNRSESSLTHFMFLDIDEFWMPVHPITSISSLIDSIGPDKAISFNWLNDLPADKTFTGIKPVLSGNTSDAVKSLVPFSRHLRSIRIHKPLLKPNDYVLADGNPFIKREHDEEHSARTDYSKAFIYHRFYRSEVEYVSSLYRGNPEGTGQPYKTNRSGMPDRGNADHEYKFTSSDFAEYSASLTEFLNLTGLRQFIDDARELVMKRHELAVKSLEANLPLYHKQIMKLFRNVKEFRIKNAISRYHDKLVSDYGKNVEAIRDLAISIEEYSYVEAKRIMLKAQALRPEGPKIKAKINEYDQKIV